MGRHLLALLVTLYLILAPLRGAVAAPAPTAGFVGQITSTVVFNLTYPPSGKATSDSALTAQYQSAYQGALIVLWTDGSGAIGRANAQNVLVPVAPTFTVASAADDGSFAVIDGVSRSSSATVSYHGYLISESANTVSALIHEVKVGKGGTVSNTDLFLVLDVQ
jgi:hypothetical protein